jgi:hypothetical protein
VSTRNNTKLAMHPRVELTGATPDLAYPDGSQRAVLHRAATMVLRTLLVVATLQCAFVSESLAQVGSSCDGTWIYTHVDKARAWATDVEVKISGDKGTYLAQLGRHKASNSPCRNINLPVVVKKCTADKLVFKVLGENVLQGCPTFTAHFNRTGPDTAEGTISRGQVVTAHRQR